MRASLVDEWVEKAEADYLAALALNRRRSRPLPDVVCYHCAQCTEKYFKAYLLHNGAAPPRIHDLSVLLDLCALHDRRLSRAAALVNAINPYGILVRYPGFSTTVAEAANAVRIMGRLRRRIRWRLGF